MLSKPNSTAFLALAAASLVAELAVAQPPAQLDLTSNSSCPSAADVVSELSALLPHTRIEPHADDVSSGTPPRTDPSASILDEGERVRVLVAGEERLFRDPARSCRERARTAAVFIGLVVDPPILPEMKPPARSPARASAPPPTPAASVAAPRVPLTLQLGPLLEAAPSSDAASLPVAGGFGGRVAWGRGLGATVGVAFLLPTRLALPAADARLVWLPLDVSLRAAQPLGPVTLAGELGPELALLFVSGDRVKNPRTSTRLEVGARAAATLTWTMSSHLGAFVTLFGVWRPKPYEFRVNPGIDSGRTPALWLGASLGLSLRNR